MIKNRKIVTNKTLIPGQPGTKKCVEKYGDNLVCVRYKYDEQVKKKIITVELIESKKTWIKDSSRVPKNKIVAIKVGYNEYDLQRKIRALEGKWNSKNKCWQLSYGSVIALNLEDRMGRKKPVKSIS